MPDTLLEPYIEALDEFPITGTAQDKLRAAVRYAVRAPSIHNTQPWRFRLADQSLELLADRSRALPVVDPDDRELTVSCGGALFHLCLTLRHFGSAPQVERLPKGEDGPDLLARVRLGGPWERTPEDEALFRAISGRRTSRQPFEERHLPEGLGAALEAAAQAQGAWLHVFRTPEARGAIAQLVSEGDRIQMADKRFRRELAAWLRPNWTSARDGMPGYALGFGDVMAAAGPLIVRTFDMGRGRAAHDEELAAGSPLLALLGTTQDTPYHWLQAGEALSHVLLRAQVDGVSASYLNQPIEVPELRPRLEHVAGRPGCPQLLLRLGMGREVPPTPRRPVSDVLAG